MHSNVTLLVLGFLLSMKTNKPQSRLSLSSWRAEKRARVSDINNTSWAFVPFLLCQILVAKRWRLPLVFS